MISKIKKIRQEGENISVKVEQEFKINKDFLSKKWKILKIREKKILEEKNRIIYIAEKVNIKLD